MTYSTTTIVEMVPEEVENPGGPRLWFLNAFGTTYRGFAVDVTEPGREAPYPFHGAETLVAVEPSGGKVTLYPSRMWHTFARIGVLHQSYVEEKFAVRGEDAIALTVLVAAMLGREAAVTG